MTLQTAPVDHIEGLGVMHGQSFQDLLGLNKDWKEEDLKARLDLLVKEGAVQSYENGGETYYMIHEKNTLRSLI